MKCKGMECICSLHLPQKVNAVSKITAHVSQINNQPTNLLLKYRRKNK